jgi:hypothetical protein
MIDPATTAAAVTKATLPWILQRLVDAKIVTVESRRRRRYPIRSLRCQTFPPE